MVSGWIAYLSLETAKAHDVINRATFVMESGRAENFSLTWFLPIAETIHFLER
jgi:hypothetical protein